MRGSSQCADPWTVLRLNQNTDKDQIVWAPQVTTSMPLEALYSLMKENIVMKDEISDVDRNVLNGKTGMDKYLQLVTKDCFRDLGLQMDTEKINDAVLGFCSLILSYAKAANVPVSLDDPNAVERSPKSFIPFMPRTEFVTIYKAVQSAFPPDSELFDIFDKLACYKVDTELHVRCVALLVLHFGDLANSMQH